MERLFVLKNAVTYSAGDEGKKKKANGRLNAAWNTGQCKAASYF